MIKLKTPLEESEIRDLNVGDIVSLDGTIITMRDAGHKRILDILRQGLKPPLDLHGQVIFHAGPVVKKKDSRWKIVSIGPTTSWRMEPYEAEVIAKTGIRMIIGKGLMGVKTVEACKRYGAVYVAYPGGLAALASKCVKRVIDVKWLDLGVPEALWILEVKNFAPLTVIIDSKGRNLYKKRMDEVMRNLNLIKEKLKVTFS